MARLRIRRAIKNHQLTLNKKHLITSYKQWTENCVGCLYSVFVFVFLVFLLSNCVYFQALVLLNANRNKNPVNYYSIRRLFASFRNTFASKICMQFCCCWSQYFSLRRFFFLLFFSYYFFTIPFIFLFHLVQRSVFYCCSFWLPLQFQIGNSHLHINFVDRFKWKLVSTHKNSLPQHHLSFLFVFVFRSCFEVRRI